VGLITILKYFLNSREFPGGAIVISTIFLTALTLSVPLIKKLAQRRVDILYYGKNHASRQELLNFAENTRSTIDLEKIAPKMLSLLSKNFQARQTSLLLNMDGCFTTRYSKCIQDAKTAEPLVFAGDSPIISWVDQEGCPVSIDMLKRAPEFSSWPEDEKAGLKAAEIEVLCPLKNQQRLVGILALSKKYPAGFYFPKDIEFLARLSGDIASNVENAFLYEKAKERANTDELTGLFNRGFFRQRLDEEIARSSRYGEVFSLILIDIDDFKKYNDLSGHLIGDEVLKRISNFTQMTVRNSDICFRYGGDELAVILPQTTIEGGRVVAERIRQGVESLTDWAFDPLTVSIGLSSWPTDGVINDDLIRSSDAALYHSKHTGKNRINLACQVALSEVFRIEAAIESDDDESKAQLKTIHTLAANLDAKDPYTSGHSAKVSLYASLIAEAMGLTADDVQRIRTAGLLHDIGKIGIPELILKRNGPLTVDEREIMRAHPNLGVSIIEHVESLRGCLAGIQYHHEHFDGGGYPSGLKGSNVPLDARILAVADAFDAMTSPRPYRKTMTRDEALNEIASCSGSQFDPQIVETIAGLRKLQVMRHVSRRADAMKTAP
jgi:diguanylate cyclase (GGDEF)-like protein/putative nucleotidyltransferase with HDIG domain